MTSILVLILAAILDYLIGDPENLLHPVQVMGWVISRANKLIQKYCHNSLTQKIAGILLGIVLVIGSGVLGWLIIRGAALVHPLLRIAIDTILLTSCFALHSLRVAAEKVLKCLAAEDIVEARAVLSNYVGRDTQNLNQSEILRAVLETVTENATDGVMAPLFYAIVGAFVPYLNPTSMALAYKASSTLDSMVGYREAPYTYLGWFSARLEDCLTWVPCRLTVITLGLLIHKPRYLWLVCRRDAVKDPSPNSGWSECAYATALGVQVGGINYYRGIAKPKPLLGDAVVPITANSIYQALQLTRNCFLLWIGGATSLLILVISR